MTGVLPLCAALADCAPEVGQKAATLGRLRGEGFPVPEGVVVVGRADGAARDGARYAVRSSAIDEDGVASSMAGLYSTFLDVAAASVPARIEDCRRAAEHASAHVAAPIPVIVQRMVDAEVAGVAFTADPVTGDRSTVVVGVTVGLGDRFTSGRTLGDEWEVIGSRAKPRRLTQRAATKQLVRRVAAMARAVAATLGSPQDVEWAWDGSEVWILQARPITGLPPEARWEPGQRGVYHRGFRFGEWISEPVTPLFETWALTRMERRLHETHREVLGQYAPLPHHVVVNGWYFYSLNFLPVPGGSLLRSLPRMLRLAIANPRRAAVMFPQTVQAGYGFFETEWRQDLGPRYRNAVADAAQIVESGSPHEIVDMIDRLADLAGEYFASIAVVAGSAYKVETSLAQLWNRHVRPVTGRSHVEALVGLGGVRYAREQPLLASLDWFVPLSTAASGTEARPSVHLAAQRTEVVSGAREALARSPRRLRRFERLLHHAQHLQPVREQQVASFAHAWPVMRRGVIRLGDALFADGSIATPDDVFFLTRNELAEALAGRELPVAVATARRAARDAARRLTPPQTVGRMPLMTRTTFALVARAFGAQEVDGALVAGVPASPGIATGPVRVLREAADYETLQPGDVIVAPVTTPALTPLFSRAAALVTDVGSGLAHASIMAREFGVPAVVGCGDATARLTDGLVVTVDGATGAVTAATPVARP